MDAIEAELAALEERIDAAVRLLAENEPPMTKADRDLLTNLLEDVPESWRSR